MGSTLCGGGSTAVADLRVFLDGTNLEVFALGGLANMAEFIVPPANVSGGGASGLASSGGVRVAAEAVTPAGCVPVSASAYRMSTIWS